LEIAHATSVLAFEGGVLVNCVYLLWRAFSEVWVPAVLRKKHWLLIKTFVAVAMQCVNFSE